jgi:dipeptidyl aminopeptidase/acylaminoacyl peptidase
MARDLASGQEREVVSTDRDWVYAFRVAPDGSLAYARRRKDSDAPPVLIVQSPSGVERELIRGEDTYEYMEVRAWSPDGTRILYTHAKGQQPNGLYLIPREGGRPLDLGVTFPRARFAWPVGFSLHPNGRVLAYPEVVMESELWLTPVSKAEPESSARLPE